MSVLVAFTSTNFYEFISCSSPSSRLATDVSAKASCKVGYHLHLGTASKRPQASKRVQISPETEWRKIISKEGLCNKNVY